MIFAPVLHKAEETLAAHGLADELYRNALQMPADPQLGYRSRSGFTAPCRAAPSPRSCCR